MHQKNVHATFKKSREYKTIPEKKCKLSENFENIINGFKGTKSDTSHVVFSFSPDTANCIDDSSLFETLQDENVISNDEYLDPFITVEQQEYYSPDYLEKSK